MFVHYVSFRLTLSHEQYDLELVFVKNSHEVVHEYMKNTEFVELMRRLGALGDGNQDQSKSLCFDSNQICYRDINIWLGPFYIQARYQLMNVTLHIYTSLLS